MSAWTKRNDMRVATTNASTCKDMVQPVIFEKKAVRRRHSLPMHNSLFFKKPPT